MDDTRPYVSLASAVVLPPLAGAITNEWEPRNPEPILLFLEAWAELLPTSVLRHLLDSLIFPKVGAAGLHNVTCTAWCLAHLPGTYASGMP